MSVYIKWSWEEKMENIPSDISIKELLTEFSPNLAKEMILQNGGAEELKGTVFSMVVEVSGEKYSYEVKDGVDFNVNEGDLDSPMVRLMISEEDILKMIQTQNLDMLIGMQSEMSKTKFNALKSLKGSICAELENDDGSIFIIKSVINGSLSPTATFKMKISDSVALIKKEISPVNLFMSGAMQIEGDIAFAMATQPLFA